MKMGNYKSIIKNKDFMLLMLSNTFSRLGTRISYIALMARAFELTNNPMSLAIVSILDLIPSIICGTCLAYLIDKLSKKKIIFMCNFICVFASLFLVFTDNIYILYLIVFLVGGMDELVYSAKSALEPQIVMNKEDLIYSNSLKSFFTQITSIVGPALGGILVALGGYKLAFLINAFSYAIPVLGITGIKYEEEQQKIDVKTLFSVKNLFRENKDGLIYISSFPKIKQVFIVSAIIQLIYGLQGPLLFPFVVEAFQIDSGYAGFLFSASGIGGLIGSLLAVKIYKGNIMTLFSGILFFDGCMFFAFTQSRIFWLSVLLFTFAGAIGTIFETIANQAIQEFSDKDYIGRVFAAKSLVADPINMAASGLGGILAQTFSVYAIFSVSAIGEVVIAFRMMLAAHSKK